MKKILEILNDEQGYCFKNIVENIKLNHDEGAFDANYILITGKAGSGKSFLSANIVKYFQDNPISKYNIQATSLTHKALNELKKKLNQSKVKIHNLNGLSTVHSYFNIKATINYKTGVEEFKLSVYAKKPKKCSILLIDEVSMMDEELFKLVKSQRHLYETIILIGDEFQVPPINNSDYNLFQDKNILNFKLNKIVRQAKDNPIIMLASEIVEKIKNKDYKNPSFCIKKTIEYAKLTNKIVVVDNTQNLVQEYFNYVASDIGLPIINSKFSKSFFTTFTNKTVDSLNYVGKCIYRQTNEINYIDVGDLLVLQSPAFDPYLNDVIIKQNNSEIEVEKLDEDEYEGIAIYNVHFEDNFIRVIKPTSMYLFEKKLEILAARAKINSKEWHNFYNFKKKFTEIKQCFAVTAHKSQGSTVDEVFIDSRDLPWKQNIDLAFRLYYVMITRCSNKCTIMY